MTFEVKNEKWKCEVNSGFDSSYIRIVEVKLKFEVWLVEVVGLVI